MVGTALTHRSDVEWHALPADVAMIVVVLADRSWRQKTSRSIAVPGTMTDQHLDCTSAWWGKYVGTGDFSFM